MNRIQSQFHTVDIIGKLADLKDDHYRSTLALSTLIDLLIEKGVFTAEQFQEKAAKLDQASIRQL